jgi:hypothetical protein
MEPVTLARGAEESGLCLMLKGLLDEGAARHGGRLRGLGSRLGVDAPDAGATATLIFGGGRCTIEEGLHHPDLILLASSEVLPRVADLPVRHGLPWLVSEAGRDLLLCAARGQLRIRGLLRLPVAPRRTLRAATDLLLLVRLLAGSSQASPS